MAPHKTSSLRMHQIDWTPSPVEKRHNGPTPIPISESEPLRPTEPLRFLGSQRHQGSRRAIDHEDGWPSSIRPQPSRH